MRIFALLILSLPFFLSADKASFSYLPIDEKPLIGINEDIVGIYKLKEDTNSHNYFVVEKANDLEYSVTYMNRGGDNRGLEHFGAYLSVVENNMFLNVQTPNENYYLLRINNTGHKGFDVEATLVTDPLLKEAKNSKQVRQRLTENLDNQKIYSSVYHFRKKLPLTICK